MAEIIISDLNKYYGSNHVLKGLDIEIYKGDRIGLLGKNGSGKTTLFKIIEGLENYESGTIIIGRDKKVGILDQIPQYEESFTVMDVLKSAFEPLLGIVAEMRKIEKAFESSLEDKLLKRYGELQTEFENGDGYNLESRINKVCNGLHIDTELQQKKFNLLSGGEQTRVNLGRIILKDSDILLLDEPTNHLDIKSIEWLEEFLEAYKGSVVIISHDRYFLDKVVNKVVEIVDGKSVLYQGNYSAYVKEKEERYQSQLLKYQEEQKKIKQLEIAAKRLHEWARNADNEALHKRAFAIEKRIERMDVTEKPKSDKAILTTFKEQKFSSNEVVVGKNISKSYGEKVILDSLDLTVLKGEHVALLGENGCGKTTLLKLLIGELTCDSGSFKIGDSINYSYLQQNVIFEKPELSILETARYELVISQGEAMRILAKYNFRGEDVFKKVINLSGGEKSRLRLLILMQQDVNLLILDEPTNHLDIASREWIEEAIDGFTGTIIFVSHDRYFIRKFADRICEIDKGKISDYSGTFEEYQQWKRQEKENIVVDNQKNLQKQQCEKKNTAHEDNGKIIKMKLEKEILILENELKGIELKMSQASLDHITLAQLHSEKERNESKLEELYGLWIEEDNNSN